MVVPIRLANRTWRGVLTGMPVLLWVELIQSPLLISFSLAVPTVEYYRGGAFA
jgi:hypothetical protein